MRENWYQPEKPLTCSEMLEQYKTHFFKQRKGNKNPEACWANYYKHIEVTFLKYKDDAIALKVVKEVIECTENDTSVRTRHLNALANILKYL